MRLRWPAALQTRYRRTEDPCVDCRGVATPRHHPRHPPSRRGDLSGGVRVAGPALQLRFPALQSPQTPLHAPTTPESGFRRERTVNGLLRVGSFFASRPLWLVTRGHTTDKTNSPGTRTSSCLINSAWLPLLRVSPGWWCGHPHRADHEQPASHNSCAKRQAAERQTRPPKHSLPLPGSFFQRYLTRTWDGPEGPQTQSSEASMILLQVHLQQPCYDFCFL